MRYVYGSQQGFEENGESVTATRLGGFDSNGLTTNLGMEFSRSIVRRGYEFVPRVSLGWAHEYGDIGFTSVGTYGFNPTTPFVMRSAEDDQNRFELGLDGRFNFATTNGCRWSVVAAYGLATSEHTTSHAISVGAELRF